MENNRGKANYNVDLSSLGSTKSSDSFLNAPFGTYSSKPQHDDATLYKLAAEKMEAAFSNLEKGNFPNSLEEVEQSFKILGSIQDKSKVRKEVKLCASYKMLLQLLIESKKAEQNVSKSAYLSRILADIPVQPKHRLVCLRMAIKKNLSAKNYRAASRFIKVILPFGLQDGKQLEELLKVCEDNKFENFQLFPYNCAACGKPMDSSDQNCSHCNNKIQFCHKAFIPINKPTMLQCSFCESVFSDLVVASNSKCSYCNEGTVNVTSVASSAEPKPTTPISPPQSPPPASSPQVKPAHTPAPTIVAPTPKLPEPQITKLPEIKQSPPATAVSPSSTSTPPVVAPVTPPTTVTPTTTQTNNGGWVASFDDPFFSTPPSFLTPQDTPQPAPNSASPSKVSEPVQSRPRANSAAKSNQSDVSGLETPKASFSAPVAVEKPKVEEKKPPVVEKKVEESKKSAPNFATVFNPPANIKLSFISKAEEEKYKQWFELADLNKDGYVDGDEAKNFFGHSSVPRKSLAQIWRLSDSDQDSRISIDEFVVAMHLALCSLKGMEIPKVLPADFSIESRSNRKESSEEKEDKGTEGVKSYMQPTLISMVTGPAPPKFSVQPRRKQTIVADRPPVLEALSKQIDEPELPSKETPKEPIATSTQPTVSGTPPPLPPKSEKPPLPNKVIPPQPTVEPEPAPAQLNEDKNEPEKEEKPEETREPEKTAEPVATTSAPPLPPKDKPAVPAAKPPKVTEKKADTAPKKGMLGILRGKDDKGSISKKDGKVASELTKAESDTAVTPTPAPSVPTPQPAVRETPKPTGPPTLSALPTRLGKPKEPKVASQPVVEQPIPAPMMPPPSLFTPPLEPPPMLFTPPLATPPPLPSTMSPPPLDVPPPIESPQQVTPLPEVPPPETRSSPAPSVVETTRKPEIVTGWHDHTVYQQGEVPQPKDFIAELPQVVSIATRFIFKIIKEADYEGSTDLLADSIKEVVTADKLQEFGEYYSQLPSLWMCTATSCKEDDDFSSVYIPLYSSTGDHQVTVWVEELKVSGLEFGILEEDKWSKDGTVETWVIDQPRIVIRTDGTVKEIKSPKEELEAIGDPKVPCALQAGPERRFKAALGQTLVLKEKKPTLQRKHKDGKKYNVFTQVQISESTRRAHPDAFAREYWIKDESHPYCHLIDRAGERINDEFYVEYTNGELELLLTHSKKKKGEAPPLATKKVPAVDHFYVGFLIPDETPTQTTLMHTIRSMPHGYVSTDQKGYIITVKPTDKDLVLLTEWEVLMRSAKLKPKYEGESFIKEEKPLTYEEKRGYMRHTPELNFDQLEFEQWCSKHGLLKGVIVQGEQDLQFAKKAYIKVVKELSYITSSMDVRVTEIVASHKADALGFNKVLVATLRANNIPARMIYRRNPTKKGVGRNAKQEPMLVHSQVYIEGIGWITTDPAPYARNSNPRFDGNKPETMLGGFGLDLGESMIYGMEGNHFVDLPTHGPRQFDLQGVTIFFDHKAQSPADWVLYELPTQNKQ